MGKNSDILDTMFGMQTYTKVNALSATIPNAVTRILDANPDRLAWFLINLGATNAYVAHTNQPSATFGIVLSANGGHIGMRFDQEFSFVAHEQWAISAAGAPAIYLIEIIGK